MQRNHPTNPSTTGGAGEKKSRGCLVFAGIAALAVLTVAGIVIGVAAWRYRTLRDDFTDAALEDVPVQQTEGHEARRLTRTFKDLQGAVRDGRQDTFAFTDLQLNQMVASVPAVRDAKGRAHFTIVDDKLKVKAGIPLDDVPGFKGRFLNGEFTLNLSLRNDQLDIRVLEATVRGQPLPDAIMAHLKTVNIADRAMQNPEFRRHLQGIRGIRIERGKLIIETGSTSP